MERSARSRRSSSGARRARGKSSLCIDIMWPLFGIRDAEPYSRDGDRVRAPQAPHVDSRSVPVFIDEYKALRHAAPAAEHPAPLPAPPVPRETESAGVLTSGEQLPPTGARLCRGRDATHGGRAARAHRHREPPTRRRSRRTRPRAPPRAALGGPGAVRPRYIQFCLGRDFDADLEVARAVTVRRSSTAARCPCASSRTSRPCCSACISSRSSRHCGCELPTSSASRPPSTPSSRTCWETDHGVKNALDHFLEMLGVMAVQGPWHKVHYVRERSPRRPPRERPTTPSARTASSIDYEGEMVDPEALRRLVTEARSRVASSPPSERVTFDSGGAARSSWTSPRPKVVTADDFPTPGRAAAAASRQLQRVATGARTERDRLPEGAV